MINNESYDVTDLFPEKLNSGIHYSGDGLYLSGKQSQLLSKAMEKPIQEKTHYDWLPILSIFVISVIIIYGLIINILYPLLTGGTWKLGSIVYLILIFGVLLIPLLRTHVNENVNKEENRTLAKVPADFLAKGKINESFGKQFESWFNDRFGARKYFLLLHTTVENLISAGHVENDKAFLGQEKWLFYKGDKSVELFQNRLQFTNCQLEVIHRNLLHIKSYLSNHNCDFYVLVAPNKADVYGEYYKKGIHKVRNEDRLHFLKCYLESQQNPFKVIYPLSELNNHKSDGLMYYKTDTHWSEAGAYVGYLALMEEIRKQHPNIDFLSPNQMKYSGKNKPSGDLTAMLNLNNKHWYDKDEYINPEPHKGFHYSVEETIPKKGGRKDYFIRTVNQNKKGKVLVFRDSFSSALIPYVSETFGEVIYIWTHDLNGNIKLVEKEKPDIVIHELVSRYTQDLLQQPTNWKDGE